MKALSIRAAAASLVAHRGCGMHDHRHRNRPVAERNLGATFSWTETGGTQGTMIAQLSNGQVYQGPIFQITSETRVDYGPLVERLGPRLRLGQRLGRPGWGYGWGGWGPWGPDRIPSHSTAARCSPTCRDRAASCAAISR